jgi:streptogramin lyase
LLHRPSPRIVAGVIGAAVVLVAGLVFVATNNNNTTSVAPPAPSTFGTITSITAQQSGWSFTDAVTAPNGTVYFAARGSQNSVARLEANGQLTMLKVPGTNLGSVVVAPDGSIFTSTTTDNASSIVKMAGDGSNVQLFRVPAVDLGAAGKRTEFPILAMTLGQDGSLWFERGQLNRWDSVGGYTSAIGRLGSTGKMDVYPIADRLYAPGGITTASNGSVWYTAACVCARNGFIEVLPSNPALDETGKAVLTAKYSVPTKAGTSDGVGPHPSRLIVVGNNLWLVEQQDDFATELTPPADLSGNGAIARIPMDKPSNEAIVEYVLPTRHSRPTGITLGGDGNLWVTESGTAKVARFSTDGRLLAEYSVNGSPDDIVTGPNGNVYFLSGGALDWTVQTHTDGVMGTQFPTFSPYPNQVQMFQTTP